MEKVMKAVVLVVVLAALSTVAMAEGGKVRSQPTPIYDVTGETVGTVIPVPDGCEVLVSQSGKAVYLMCEDN